MPDHLRLTADQKSQLGKIQDAAKIRHEKARKAARKRGRTDFPLLPVECSWAFEEKFRKGLTPAGKL